MIDQEDLTATQSFPNPEMISKYLKILLMSGLAGLLLVVNSAASVLSELEQTELPENLSTQATITTLINALVNTRHFHRTPLDDQFSEKILENYINRLDPAKSYFLQEDMDQIEALEHEFDDYIRNSFLKPAYAIFRIYRERVNQRIEFAVERLGQPFDFTIDEEYLLDSEDAPWAQTVEQLNDNWRKRIKNDIINLRLSKKPDDEIQETLTNRYIHIARRTRQLKSEDVFQSFINSWLSGIEPYTLYHSPRGAENFNIQMRLSLEGIGAVLQSDNEFTEIRRVIAGGPAEQSGKLDSGDRIIGVGQENEEIVDVIGWRLDDVVSLIRGPKGSTVILEVLPAENGLDSGSETIFIIRDEIKLEEQAASSQIIGIPTENGTSRVGVIQLPSFYTDFNGRNINNPDYRSTTRDVKRLLAGLESENTDGLIMDLRGNGGGSLDEAISLTGLFIRKGPVVQVKFSDGTQIDRDPDPAILYDGPLAVLVDRHSASASEIFAGAIQDYNRGLILGEPTFGKGTVQTLVNLNHHHDSEVDLGQLKMTIAQFFRVNGDSTQYRGVIPDITWDFSEIDDRSGERANDSAIPWRQIGSVAFEPFRHQSDSRLLDRVTSLHRNRARDDPEFTYFREVDSINRSIRQMKTVPLSQEKRQQLRTVRDQKRLDLENARRAGSGQKTLPTVESLEQAEREQNDNLAGPGDSSADQSDPLLIEGARILLDFEHYAKRFSNENSLSGG